jgi:hypothetical protein
MGSKTFRFLAFFISIAGNIGVTLCSGSRKPAKRFVNLLVLSLLCVTMISPVLVGVH